MVTQIPLFLIHAAEIAACRALNNSSGCGEISGSVGITTSGEVVLTAKLERWTIELEVTVVTNEEGNALYRCKPQCVSIGIHEILLDDKHHFVTRNAEEAIMKCTNLVRTVCPVLMPLTVDTIPRAIHRAWKEPEATEKLIVSIVNEHS